MESLLNKVEDLTDCNFIKKRLQCFPVNITKFIRTVILQTTAGGCFCTLGTTVPEDIDIRNGKKRSHNKFFYNYVGSPTQADHNS